MVRGPMLDQYWSALGIDQACPGIYNIVWRIEAQNGPEVKVDYIRSPVAGYC